MGSETAWRLPAAVALIGLVGLVLSLGVVGCGAIGGGDFSTDYGGSMGMSNLPGQIADGTTFVTNRSHRPAQLLSATLIGADGIERPQLVHVAVVGNPRISGESAGWPPGRTWRTEPLAGRMLAPGVRTTIIYGVTGSAPGHYAVAGLRLRIRTADGHVVTARSLLTFGLCVVAANPHPCPQQFINRLNLVTPDD